MISTIEIQGLKLHAFHGVLPQERTVGNSYRIDAILWVDYERAMRSDELADTVNYAAVIEAIQDEMHRPSQLLEHVAGRILRRLRSDFPSIQKVDLRIAKLSPPVSADIEACAIHVIE